MTTKNPPEVPFDTVLDEILVLTLREAFVYAYNKGQQHDQVPDHLQAEAIKRKGLEAIRTALQALVTAQKPKERINTDPGKHERFVTGQQRENRGYNFGIRDFETNLLKALKGGSDES